MKPYAHGNKSMNGSPQRAFRTLYLLVVGLGLATVALALYRVIADNTPAPWVVLALLAAAMGSFSLKIPGINGRVSAGDTITCLSILLFGPFAGALTAALEAAVGSLRCSSSSRRMEFTLYNSGCSALSACAAGAAVHALLGKNLWHAVAPVDSLILALCLLAGGYFLLHTMLVAAAVALEKSLRFIDSWFDGFSWTCVNYLAGAFVAGMLAQVSNPLSGTVFATIVFSCTVVYLGCRTHVRLTREVRELKRAA